MHLISLKEQAIKLRKEGHSYAFIAEKLSVAKSTLSLWLKGISFVPNEFTKNSISQGQKKSIEYKRVDKMLSLNSAIQFAEQMFEKLSERELLVLGIGIYIGEGSKVGNYIRVANSDPRIIKFMMLWFKKCFKLTDSNFKVRVHTYPDNDEAIVLSYWRKELKLSSSSFHPCYIDKRSNKKKNRQGVLPYGTAHLSIVGENAGVLLHRKILASIDRVLR